MKNSKRERIELPKRVDYNYLLEETSIYSRNHKDLLKQSTESGCYYCCNFFPSSDVKEWCDDGETALCPKCGVDSVIPSVENELTLSTLKAMSKYWFDVSAYKVEIRKGKVVDIVDVDGLYDPSEFAIYRTRQLEYLEKRNESLNEKRA